ncbi:MAG TPA: hypothetical protein VJT16_16185 [Streptosporangiaceae bacterium]|nr:hypothetical protein [Streptosporangiaceae bacterium]
MVYTQKPAVVLPWALCVLGLSAFAPVIPAVPRLLQLGIIGVIGIALVASSVIVFVNPKLLTRTTVHVIHKQVPTPAPALKTDIELAPVSEPIPFCNVFAGTGTIPNGYELWIFDKDAEDASAKYYLDTQAVQSGKTWTAGNIEIGDGAGDTGHQTTVFAVLVPRRVMRWMRSFKDIESGIPSPELPPDSVVADQTVVTRSSDKKPCKF